MNDTTNTQAAARQNNSPDRSDNRQSGQIRPRLAIFHASPQGTGAVLKLELHPAHDYTEGSIWATIAPQTAIGNMRGPNPSFARFGWDDAIVTKLDFCDLTKILTVLNGEAETIDDGMGLLHRSPTALTKIHLKHYTDPVNGYSFEFYRTSNGVESSARIFLSRTEAIGVKTAIESSFGYVCFGLPMVIQRDTAAYRAAARGMRNAPAA